MTSANKKILLLIIVLGVILRFYNFHLIPFTHDEFSALFRTNFDNFTDLIEKGVKIDGHPAGIQVFLYYWVKVFGKTEWVVKLPFLIFGILSIYIFFLIAKIWFNETVALVSAAYLASLQFSVLYSQIARPYMSGLFFSLSMFYFWSKIIKTPSRDFYKNSLFFVIFLTLCAYNHYFSMLLAGIVGVYGLFLIDRRYLFKYVICLFITFLLYLPHLKIFFFQLNVGGVGGWLGKPNKYFILDFIYYIFHFSNYVLLVTIAIAVFGFYKNKISNLVPAHYLLFSILFFLPILIGYFYSMYVNPVLQFSVLIFSFPYIFFLMFGHIQNQKPIINLFLVVVILLTNIVTLVFERQHYKIFYNSVYQHILTDCQNFKKDTATIFLIDSHRKISAYYFNKLDLDSNFLWLEDFGSERDLIKFLQKASVGKKQLYFGCVSSVNPAVFPILNEYFPKLVCQKNYARGTTYLLSTEKSDTEGLVTALDFESSVQNNWPNVNTQSIVDSLFYSGRHAYLLDSTIEWGPTFTVALQDIVRNEKDFIDVSVKFKRKGWINEVMIVSQLESLGKLIDWRSSSFEKYFNSSDDWHTAYHSIKLSDVELRYKNIQLTIFIWNKGRSTFYIDDFKIWVRNGNNLIYAVDQKIK